jgi:hypothetical protein
VLVVKRLSSWLDPFPDLFLDFFLEPFAWLICLLEPFALLLAPLEIRGIPILLRWHPWPGLFVLILGAASVVMVVKPPASKTAKACWVLLAMFLMFLEIRSLKLADDDSQAKFGALLTRFDETLATMTGGESWPDLELEEYPLEKRPPLHVPILSVRGRHPLRGLQLRVIDYRKEREAYSRASQLTVFNYWTNQFATIVSIGDRPGNSRLYLNTPTGIDTSPDGDKRYFIESQAMNGNWREAIQYIRIAGKWEHAIRVRELSDSKGNVTGKIIKIDISRGFPTVGGKVDWEENSSMEPRPGDDRKMDTFQPELPAR